MSTTKGQEEELVNFDDAEIEEDQSKPKAGEQKDIKKGYVAIHSSGFRDFLLKPELLRAIVDCGFELPSEVQHECIPQAILGMDVLCQAKSGMGKTAVFVIAVLQQLQYVKDQVQALILCHTRELAFQISNEFVRFSKYLPEIKTAVFYGGISKDVNEKYLKNETPNIVVGTPGRIADLVKEKKLDVSKVKHFVIDECDQVLQSDNMRQDVQAIFKKTPHAKQVMMFSATLNDSIKVTAKLFMQQPMEVYVDDQTKLTLHGLQQYFVTLTDKEKNKKLNALLDALDFNQVVIFVKSVNRAADLSKLLTECGFPSICIHSDLPQEERIKRYQEFKKFAHRILVCTDIFGRGIDVQRVNIVINYDMPDSSDQYLHRVGRAGRFGTKGLAISFVASDSQPVRNKQGTIVRKTDAEILSEIQVRFHSKMKELPDKIDTASYMTS